MKRDDCECAAGSAFTYLGLSYAAMSAHASASLLARSTTFRWQAADQAHVSTLMNPAHEEPSMCRQWQQV